MRADTGRGPLDARLDPRDARPSALGLANRWIAFVFLAIAVGMIPWMVFLGLSLPPRYEAGHWNLIWIGFDGALVGVLTYTAWAAWFHRQIMASTTLVAATLLFCDAWFDILTSVGTSGAWVTLTTGFGAEIPLGLFFVWLYRRIVMRTLAAYHEVAHDGETPTRFRDARIVFGDEPARAGSKRSANRDGGRSHARSGRTCEPMPIR